MAPKNDIPAYILGIGCTKFVKPRGIREYPEMGYEAGVKAMLDAQFNYDDVKTGIVCCCYGDTTSGQRIFYQLGKTSIPIHNTNNACATRSTGLHLARTLIRNGTVDCALIIAFENMDSGCKVQWQGNTIQTNRYSRFIARLVSTSSFLPCCLSCILCTVSDKRGSGHHVTQISPNGLQPSGEGVFDPNHLIHT